MPAYLRVDHDHGEVIVPVQDAAPLVIQSPASSDLAVVASGASILGTVLLVIGLRALRRRKRHVPRL